MRGAVAFRSKGDPFYQKRRTEFLAVLGMTAFKGQSNKKEADFA